MNANPLPFVDPKELKTVVADPQLIVARYSPCGRILAGASFDGRVRRWSALSDDLIEIGSLGGHHAWCTAVAFRADGDWLFSADSWGQIRAWNGVSGLEQASAAPAGADTIADSIAPRWVVEQAHDGWIRDLAVSPDGSLLASCGADQQLKLWSATDGKPKSEFATGRDLYCLRFAPGGETLFAGDDRGMVKQWKLDGSLVRQFDAHELHTLSRLQDVGGVRAIALSPGGNRLAVGGAVPKNGATITGDPTVYLFDVATGERQTQFLLGDAQDVGVADLHWHVEELLLAVTNGTPGKGKLVCLAPGRPEPLFQSTKVVNCQSLSVRPDGRRLAVVATNNGSNGNGRRVDKHGNYLGNQSPIHVFSLGEG